MNLGLIIAFVLLLGILALVSYVERLYAEMGKFLSREFQENIENFEKLVEPRLGMARERAALSVAILEQLATAAIAVLIAFDVFHRPQWRAADVAQAALLLVIIILVVVVFNRLLPFVLFSRTRGKWLRIWTPLLRALI